MKTPQPGMPYWGYMCNTNEICDTYPESSWYKLLKNARKSLNNHKSYCTLLDNFGQKYSKMDTVVHLKIQLGQAVHFKVRLFKEGLLRIYEL